VAYSRSISIDLTGDKELFERVSKRFRKPRELLRLIGVHVMGQATHRLTQVLGMGGENAVRTGPLPASLNVSPSGQGSADTIFELSDERVEVGSNLRYAAQVHYGGRIVPKPPHKALAIPLPLRVKRNELWPSELDPDREVLDFVPKRGGASGNVIGLLVDTEGEFGFGEGEALYALAKHVDQEGKPYLYGDDEDRRIINEELVPEWLEL